MRGRQLTFFQSEPFRELNRRAHGGSVTHGKRKSARPFDPKRPLHVVLRSTQARGTLSFLHARNQKRVNHWIHVSSARTGVRVYRFANAGNHIHLVVRAKERRALADFLRILAGAIALAVTGAKKGRAHAPGSLKTQALRSLDPREPSRSRSFWDALAYSRIVEWGRELARVCEYLDLNALEGMGWRDFSPRKGQKSAGFS